MALYPPADWPVAVGGTAFWLVRFTAAPASAVSSTCADTAAALARAAAGGGRLLDGLRDRSWGERVGYALDPDGHVLALAVPAA